MYAQCTSLLDPSLRNWVELRKNVKYIGPWVRYNMSVTRIPVNAIFCLPFHTYAPGTVIPKFISLRINFTFAG